MKLCTVCEHEEYWHKERDTGFKSDKCTKTNCVCIKFSIAKINQTGRMCNCPCHNSDCVNICNGCGVCTHFLIKTKGIKSWRDKLRITQEKDCNVNG